ncbi:MAG: ATP cone domain-containing protein [Proteobacteria bacterium]|nr:ATP cone domain-containing protein [Pseudomonadota bacterium]
MTVQCPYCGADSQVVDSRATTEGVRRRRLCNGCKRRFTTYERVGAPSLKVIKRSDKNEPFDSDKLQRALARVCRNRPTVTAEAIRRIVRDIEAHLLDSGAKYVRSGQIVTLALERLIEIDKLSYERLATDYIDEDGQLRTDHKNQVDEKSDQLDLFQADD